MPRLAKLHFIIPLLFPPHSFPLLCQFLKLGKVQTTQVLKKKKTTIFFSFSSCHANTVVPSKVIWQRQGSPGFGCEGSSQKQTEMCHLTVGTSGCTQSATSCSSFSSLMLTKRQEKRKEEKQDAFQNAIFL